MDNTKKTYSPAEAAIKILEHVKEMYKDTDMYKSNTAHEIESGSDPKTLNAECPEQLAEGDNIKNAKKKHNESGNESDDGDDESIPEHEEGLSPEDKELHDSTESESDEEEVEEEMDAEAHERDEEDADDTEEGAESSSEKIGNEEDLEESDEESDKESGEIVDGVVNPKKKVKKDKFEKSEKLEKSLLPKEAKAESPTKSDAISSIKWRLRDLKDFNDCRWTIEEEFPKHKEIFEKIFEKLKRDVSEEIEKYSKLKKNEFEKFEKLEKSLFPKNVKVCTTKPRESRDSVMEGIRYQIKELNEVKECRWMIEKEFPKHREIFEKVFQKLKQEINAKIKKYSKLKKGEFDMSGVSDLLAKACVDKACGLKSPKLSGFMNKRSMKKGKVIGLASGKTISDESNPDGSYRSNKEIPLTGKRASVQNKVERKQYHKRVAQAKQQSAEKKRVGVVSKSKKVEEIKKPSVDWMKDRGKLKEERQAKRDPSKDLKDRHYRRKVPKKVMVDKEKGNKSMRRKTANRRVEKMLGIKDQTKEAYKKPQIPKVNEGY